MNKKLLLRRLIACVIVSGLLSALHSDVLAQADAVGQDGSKLWFTTMNPATKAMAERPLSICIQQKSSVFSIISEELQNGLSILFDTAIPVGKRLQEGAVYVATSQVNNITRFIDTNEFNSLGDDGFIIRSFSSPKMVLIASNTEQGALYGVFSYLRLLQTTDSSLHVIDIKEIPSYRRRILNHWDNLDGSVERGYAGHSIWKWDELPGKISPRYRQYARANASIGINGTVLNNVNARPEILKQEYLLKVKAIADVLRPYGMKVYLAVNFSSPKELDGLATADPFNNDVKDWWQRKAAEIYRLIPDFGGFLVKANSEGLPGPQDFGRTHADGANMLADALAPFGGIVMWRAFVYNPGGDDRAKQAYNEFMPLDGKFRPNVMIQVKNGPIDFQPREPFSPLFGNMKQTRLMPELQITQEYLGFSDHLVYLGTLFKEFLDADTYTLGKNTTVARLTDGSVFQNSTTGIAGVANIGDNTNWCGHHFAQANWYVFGRLAWNNRLSAKEVALEWLKQSFTHDEQSLAELSGLMMQSREAAVNYMTPIGLHHLMGWDHHYGPEPWCTVPGARPDWLPSYYHKADHTGIGFNRTSTGSKAVDQYAEPLRSMFDDPALCPEAFLLWFHHLPWDYTLRNGNELWAELCYKYSSGVDAVKRFQKIWENNRENIDSQRFTDVTKKLAIQAKEAIWWRDACLLYFQTFSRQPIPPDLDRPVHQLDELKKLKFNLKHHN
ncbi:alpha-glucuronidase family glycosyl hydrolase [Gaoshiqia sp. Z1-71]|uniref:alpha-glucuronidase family glycosyl hydrolase n=1 Tax=Gaoshiqia hydrogeniformans TaxID=3290090 RepID=UPI003BF86776